MTRVVDFDFETFLIGPGMALPEAVVMAHDDGTGGRVVPQGEGLNLLEGWLRDPGVMLVNHSIEYDLGVAAAERPELLPLIVDKIASGGARCVRLREKMIAIARGELKFSWDPDLGEWRSADFSLARMTQRRLRKWRKKGADSWQKRWSEMRGVPVAELPEDAVQYCREDVEDARRIFFVQEDEVLPEGIPHEQDELESAFWLELWGAWGSRTDPAAVESFVADLDVQHAAAERRVLRLGLARSVGKKNPKVVKDSKAIQRVVREWHESRGLAVPMTEPSSRFPRGQVCTDRDVLTAAKYAGRHRPRLAMRAYSELVRIGKIRSTYAPILRAGTTRPVTPSYNTPIETYRTSCAGPNMQNLPRKGGIRSCFIPRAGWWYAFCDYDTLEMRTLAQACLDIPEVGYSDLAVALRAGLDPHVELASVLLNMTSQEAQGRYADGDPGVDNARQFSKIGNYGLGGGMGPPAFVDYARGYGLEISLHEAYRIWEAFRTRWSEMPAYFAYCSMLAGPAGEGTVIFPRSGLIRGRVPYTAICNGFFQHPAAMGAKAALRAVSRECWLESDSPLAGSRGWYFGHDELGLEVPGELDRASAAAERLREVMVERMQPWAPDVPISATAVLTRRMYKGAKPLRDARGRLVPVRPEGKSWVMDLPN